MSNLRLCLYLTILLLASCTSNTTAPTINWCDRDSIITVSDDDVFTPGTAREILLHNNEFRVVCR